MKNIKRRVLSMLLACVMVLGLCGQALATDGGTDYENHWAKDSIQALVDLGYVKGYGNGEYRPNNNMTRAEMMAMVNRIAGFTEGSDRIADYTDVKETAWYYNDVSCALEAGYIQGTSTTTMDPQKNILRQEVMTILARVLELENSDLSCLDRFSDKDRISGYAKAPIAGMVTEGYVVGSKEKDGTYIKPRDYATRAEIFTMLYRMLDVLEGIGEKTEVTDWNTLYTKLGASGDYDAVTSATGFSSYHAKDIPTVVHRVTDDEEKTTALDGVVLTNPETTISVSASSSAYTTSRYGDGEFVINVTSEDESYVWNDYIANLYAATISDGTTTVGALPWVDFYGEQATAGPHFQKVEIAINNGTSVGANAAEVDRFAAFYNEDGTVKVGTYTVTVYSEGFTTITQSITVLPTYTGTVTIADATTADTTLTVSGLPTDIADAAATITSGSGRNTVTIASAVAIADGKLEGVDLSGVADGTTLNVAIASSNYMGISTTVKVTEAAVAPVTYTGKATVADVDGDFDDYQITATVTVENDTITAIEITTGDGYSADNDAYLNWAENGRTKKNTEYKGVIAQLVGKNVSEVSGLRTNEGIDAVSGATCSSNAILAAVQDALK